MSPAALRIGLLALALAWGARPAWADGGTPVARGEAGPFQVDVLAGPAPLRAGPVEWSVLVRERGAGALVLDAQVELALQPAALAAASGDATAHHGGAAHPHPGPAPAQVAAARRGAGANRLYYTARLAIPAAGAWRAAVRIRRAGEEGALAFPLHAAPASGPLAAHWRALAFPPLGIGLFALHQWLSRAGRRAATRRSTRAAASR